MTNFIVNIFFCMSITFVCYLISLKLYRKYKKSWLNPLYTASILLILLLLVLPIQGESYREGSFIFNQLLQLAVVSLAVPLYKQWSFLKKNFKKICTGVICGTALGLIAVLGMSQIFHLPEQTRASLIPRSVTLPIALTVSRDLGGLTSTTVIFVIISALISLTIGPKLLKRFGVRSKSAMGLAMGTSAQMLGANRSLVWGEEEGAMGSIAMTTSALFLSVFVPILAYISHL
ncbi:LrgB family protein [Virgibacillus dakarensis]|uniref:Membrane protein n=1 Tax=Lentibacillus populi TaxID=1827502 RepID=A0A9W5TVY4_9BACI|nr:MULTISPECIES: LrgB family protein [Bacillaceae]MBT2214346.1 LrgB family protein [Virgibacillus dakarensis]MTW85023.1 LrgB family protein [Virgibacillus dakarensis]GGB34147.1 membrane protein [Lentibacillus populi]